MPRSAATVQSHHELALLSHLLLPPADSASDSCSARAKLKRQLLSLNREGLKGLITLAQTNHVIVRGLEVFLDVMRDEQDSWQAEFAQNALEAERKRIATAIHFLHEICSAFEEHRHSVIVIKSLDHWPDLGSDLDVYTDVKSEDVMSLMRKRFEADVAPRSWGDRLANKWNFLVPGLPEPVEVHIGRLGQTGEHSAFASSLVARSAQVLRGGYCFHVPSASDRITISTLQRMYRHFYFRLCDLVDTAALADAGNIDYGDLLASAQTIGIWEGVATYLVIVSDYLKSYRGSGLDMPSFVTASAQFGGSDIYFGRGFLRVPIVPQSARLYKSQLAGALNRRELESGVRLSLLPWLATAAMLGHKLTGSDKGIW